MQARASLLLIVECLLLYLESFIEIRGRPSPGDRERPILRVSGQVNQPTKLPPDVHAAPVRGHLCFGRRRGNGSRECSSEGGRFVGGLIAREVTCLDGVGQGTSEVLPRHAEPNIHGLLVVFETKAFTRWREAARRFQPHRWSLSPPSYGKEED